MVAAILPFATTDLITVRQVGVGLALAVLIGALIVRRSWFRPPRA